MTITITSKQSKIIIVLLLIVLAVGIAIYSVNKTRAANRRVAVRHAWSELKAGKSKTAVADELKTVLNKNRPVLKFSASKADDADDAFQALLQCMDSFIPANSDDMPDELILAVYDVCKELGGQ